MAELKKLEKAQEIILDPSKHIIIRLDGHKFSKIKFEKPFEDRLGNAMVETTKDLLERFGAYTAFTQSDEITLFIPSLWDNDVKKDWVHIFGGRVQKITSVIAGYTTMRFNSNYSGKIDACFDCRVYTCHSDSDVIRSFSSRVSNCEKNSRSMFAHAYCSHNDLHGLSGEERVKFAENNGADWSSVSDIYKYGTFVKKESYLHPSGVTRQRICTFLGDNYNYYSGLILLKSIGSLLSISEALPEQV